MVLLPKGKEEYQGIGLAEVAWKVCTVVLDLRLKRGVKIHDSLHRFQREQGTGIETIKAWLDQ